MSTTTYRMNGNDLALARQQKKADRKAGRSQPFKFSRNINPLIKQLFERVERDGVDLPTLVAKSGLSRSALYNMRHTSSPTIDSFEALANSLGLGLKLYDLDPNPPGRSLLSKPDGPIDNPNPPGHIDPTPPSGNAGTLP